MDIKNTIQQYAKDLEEATKQAEEILPVLMEKVVTERFDSLPNYIKEAVWKGKKSLELFISLDSVKAELSRLIYRIQIPWFLPFNGEGKFNLWVREEYAHYQVLLKQIDKVIPLTRGLIHYVKGTAMFQQTKDELESQGCIVVLSKGTLYEEAMCVISIDWERELKQVYKDKEREQEQANSPRLHLIKK